MVAAVVDREGVLASVEREATRGDAIRDAPTTQPR
jgi:hypothetical protein